MRNLGVKILIIAAVFTVFVMLPKIADADGYSLEINPGIIKIKASPPALVKTGIRIKNYPFAQARKKFNDFDRSPAGRRTSRPLFFHCFSYSKSRKARFQLL